MAEDGAGDSVMMWKKFQGKGRNIEGIATRSTSTNANSIQPLSACLQARSDHRTDMMVITTAETESHEGKRKTESLWPIMRITHTRSRYIYDLYYKREAISKELYDWLIKQEYADAKSVSFHFLNRLRSEEGSADVLLWRTV